MPQLARETPRDARRGPGLYGGNTAGEPSRVGSYRYPSDPSPLGNRPCLSGPEQVFRFRLTKPVANFGVVRRLPAPRRRASRRASSAAGDENRLIGYTGLPLNLNPYCRRTAALPPSRRGLGRTRGAYDIVFDTPSRAGSRASSPSASG